MKSRSPIEAATRISVFAVLAITALVFLVPVYALVLSAFRPGQQLLRFGITFNTLVPTDFTLKSIHTLFTARDGIFLSWFRNSVVILVLRTSISIMVSAFVGYGLAVYDFVGRRFLLGAVVLLMVVPIQILILPLFNLMITLGLMNTFTGVILPFLVLPFAIFFFRQYAGSLPTELIDSGRVDGVSEFGIYFRIMMPLMVPAFGAMIILISLMSWNDFVWPLVVLRSNDMFTVPLGLNSLLTPYQDNYDMLLSGAFMATLPVFILFFLFQRFFVSGLGEGAVKG
jgi:arabinosaccharide transport system permease protein